MKDFKTLEIKEILKSLLKKNKHKYSDLAEFLECSEPTVKRILGAEELTLTRLIKICEYLKISLTDLELLMKKDERQKTELTEKQQIFLVENKNYFAFLFEIYREQTPEQIAEKYKLNSKSLQKYLINLEKYDLIKITSKNKVRPFYQTFPHLGNGPLGVAYYRSFIQNASAFFIDHISEDISQRKSNLDSKKEGSSFAIHSMSVSPETYKQFIKEVEEKFHELERLANFEEKTLDAKKLKVGVVLLGTTLVESDYKELQTLQKTFGEITNI